MIKAAGKTGIGQDFLFLGLSGENVTRLVAGEPIRIRSAEMSALGLPPMLIVLHYGRTENAIRDELYKFGVQVHD